MKLNFLHIGKVLLCFAALFLFGNKIYAQPCTPTYFQGCAFGNQIEDFILNGESGTSISDLATGCSMTTGPGFPPTNICWRDMTGVMSVKLAQGTLYTAQISDLTTAFPPPPAPSNIEIWIDFDDDDIFTAAESVGGGLLPSSTPTPIDINIPAAAALGVHRMRVEVNGQFTYGSINPCPDGTFGTGPDLHGEVHDYDVDIVTSAPACPVPAVTLGAATCSTQVITWTTVSGATGYEYVLNTTAGSPAGSGTTIAGSPYNASSLTPGTTYYFHLRTNCGTGFSSWVNTPFTTPGPGAITGNPATCPGTPTQLSNSAGGGAWTSSNTNAATVSGTGLVTGVASGSTVISYTVAGCTATFSMTVGNMPPINGTTTLCPGGTSQLTDAVPGGTWSSSNPTVASVGTSTGLVTAGSGSGTAVVTYSSAGCSATVTITVSPLPAISGGNTVCVGNTLALSNSTPGGTWSSSNPGAATVGTSTGVVTGASVGTTVIQYSLSGCSVTKTVTVGAAIGAITGVTNFCVTGGTTLSCATPGGTWSSSDNTIASVSSTGAVDGVAPGTATISYTVGSCSQTAVVTVDPSTVTISGPDSVCKGVGHEVTLSSNSTGGTWSSSATTKATVGLTTGVVTGVTSGSAFTITYSVTNSCGALTATKAMYVRSQSKCTTGFEAVENTIGDLKVFPNPNNGTFTINFASDISEDVQVVVTNIVGAKVKEFTMATNTKTDLQLAVPSGILPDIGIIGAWYACEEDRYRKISS